MCVLRRAVAVSVRAGAASVRVGAASVRVNAALMCVLPPQRRVDFRKLRGQHHRPNNSVSIPVIELPVVLRGALLVNY
jgi:hypothetical protein